MKEYISHGKLSIRVDSLENLSFEEAREKHPTIKESLLLGAWKIVNPKGKLKKEVPKKEKEDK